MGAPRALLRCALPDQLRDRHGHRPRAGVRVRDELVGVLEVRRGRVRRPARDRGARGVHARIDVHRALDLRAWPPQAEGAPRHDLPRLGGDMALRLLHHRRELVDAAPRRLRDQRIHEHRPGERHRGDHVLDVRDLRLRPRHPGRLPDRWLRRARGRRLASQAGPERRRLPLGRQARDRADGATVRVPALLGQRVRDPDDQGAADEDRRDGGALGHRAAGGVLDLPDRRLHRRATRHRASRSRSPASCRTSQPGRSRARSWA